MHANEEQLAGVQEVHVLAPTQPVNMEADADTTRAVQRVFALVRNGEAVADAKGPPLTLDDVVRFYNVSLPLLLCSLIVQSWACTELHLSFTR